jgi:hypothetical protein
VNEADDNTPRPSDPAANPDAPLELVDAASLGAGGQAEVTFLGHGDPADFDPRAAASPTRRGRDLVADQTAGGAGTPAVGPPFGGQAAATGGPAGGVNPLRGGNAPAGSAAPDGGKPGTHEPGAETADLEKPDTKNAGAAGPGPLGRAGEKARRHLSALPITDEQKEMGAGAVGQTTAHLDRGFAARYGVPPKLFDWAKGSKPVRRAVGRLLLPQATKDAFLNSKAGSKGLTNSKAKKGEKAGASGSGSGAGRGRLTAKLGASALVLVPLLLMTLLLAFIMGSGIASGISFGDTQTQPDDSSNAKVAKHFPEGWQRMLEQTADQGNSGADDFSTVPWTVLAGIVATQTDFARYSPYDNVDRDPGRSVTPLPTGGGGVGGDPTTVGITSGAGPGPISGVSGTGQSGSVSPDHPGPPRGDLSHQLGWFMYAMRMHESDGNYEAGKGRGGACGAYQYLNSTWTDGSPNGGHPTACDAPPSMQDHRARKDFLAKWQKYHTWQQAAAGHFHPDWAGSTRNWNRCPAACDFKKNPTVWEFVDDVMKRMRAIAKEYPAGSAVPAPTAQPAMFLMGAGAPGDGVRAGVFADGCQVANPTPDIGGRGSQGSGPYLINPAAAADMRSLSLDPQNPCDSSVFVTRELVDEAKRVHSDPDAPEWVPDGTAKDQTNARAYWSKVIEVSGLFVDRSADPTAPCAVPPPDDPEKPWSISFKIISIWRCETTRMPELHLVTGGKYVKDKFTYTVEADRGSATEMLVNEAMSVSYGAGKWKTDKCDNGKNERQGVFPMTKEEAAAAGVTDRCDVDKNITGAARLVLSVEKVPPEERPADLGMFQPMVGGWQKLGIAMGTDLELFSSVGPGTDFTASDACTAVMTRFLTSIAPHASAFATLEDPPEPDEVYGDWEPRLTSLVRAHGLTDPASDPACVVGSWAPGFNATLAQIAAGLAGDAGANVNNLDGLGNYYLGKEDANQPTDPVLGADTLVMPRLALRPLKEIGAPIAPDATDAWSLLGSTDGVTIPLDQVAIEYAWFFGGVIAPFDSAGTLIGSLASGSSTTSPGTTQVTVGPDGCPKNAPPNTLRQGAAEIGINKLCADSVAKARTPQAAMAIKWALTHLNLPYCMCNPQRNQDNYADCSSFVSKAYRNSGAIPNLYRGNAPTTRTFRTVRWMHQIPYSQAKPGDLVETNGGGHVSMQLANGYKVHTNTSKDFSRVERAYSPADVYWVGRVDASKV